jgi:GGDEF domain-containing protein
MAEFNPSELDHLERRELHLSILAAVIVLVNAGGVALLMYPLVFVHPDEGNKWTLRFAFLGFCVLTILFVAYLLDRQRTMRRLKQQLVSQLKRNLELRHQADADLLHTIPDLSQFQDRLAMEFRRASVMERTLSLVVVKVKLAEGFADADEGMAALGEAARAIARNLRPSDSMYLLGPGVFGAVLPDTDKTNANRIMVQLEETLRFIEAKNKFSFETFGCNYPEHVKSAFELEELVSSLLVEKQPRPESIGTR